MSSSIASNRNWLSCCKDAKRSVWRPFIQAVVIVVLLTASGCTTHSSLRQVIGDQSATNVQVVRLGLFDVIVSRSYIGGGNPMPTCWQESSTRGLSSIRVACGAHVHPKMATIINATVDFLEDDLGLTPSIGRLNVSFVPEGTGVYEVRRSVAKRGGATLHLWSEAKVREVAAVARVVRSVAHEMVHVSIGLNGPAIEDEAEERLAYLVEHCAVLNVLSEVSRMPVAVLHGDGKAAPAGLRRSLAAQTTVFAEFPEVVRQGTPEAEALFQRCRAAIASARAGE